MHDRNPARDDDAILVARPHFRREGDDLYFFLSNRVFHHLEPAEARIWDSLERGPVDSATVKDEAAVKSLKEAGLVEIVARVRQEDRRRVLVVEPHCDDAALSIGATMWKMRHSTEFHVLTMASRSNYTTAFHMHRDYFNRSQITKMRTSEGEIFAQHLGGHYHCAGLPEATLRYSDSDWNLEFFSAHEVATAISNNRRAAAGVLWAWVERLREFLKGRSFDEIWLPLGAGTHSDHDLARNAALRVLLEDRPHAIVRLYEDVPYGAEFQEHTNRILRTLEKAGATLVPWWQNVAPEFASKLSMLGIFASQFKVGSIRAGVERSASQAAGAEQVERLWTVESLPKEVPEDELWIGAPEVAQTSAKLPKFGERASTERRLAIFAISPSGRWAEDVAVLTKLFPSAKLVVYAGPRVCAEFRAVEDHRVEVHCVDGRASSWIKAALREVATGHRLVIAGDASMKAKALGIVWPVGRNLVCSSMDHVIQGLAGNTAA